MGGHLSYANAVRGRVVDARSSVLKGWRCRDCGSWDVYAAVLGNEKDSKLGSHNKQDLFDQSSSGVGVGSLGVRRHSSSSKGEIGLVKPLIDSPVDVNKFQVLRDLLGDYPSSEIDSVGEASVIPESSFDGVVAVHSPFAPIANGNELVVYSRRKEKGIGKLINEVGSCSSSLLGCGGANEGDAHSLSHAQNGGSLVPFSPIIEQVRPVSESSSWVLDRFIIFCKRMGLAIEGRESELLSFLASLDSIRAKDCTVADVRDRVQEEGEVS